VGRLSENFLLIERKKTLAFTGSYANMYFWRPYTGAELDYVEEQGGEFRGYEFKDGTAKARVPKAWIETYPRASGQFGTPDNFLDFLIPQKNEGVEPR